MTGFGPSTAPGRAGAFVRRVVISPGICLGTTIGPYSRPMVPVLGARRTLAYGVRERTSTAPAVVVARGPIPAALYFFFAASLNTIVCPS